MILRLILLIHFAPIAVRMPGEKRERRFPGARKCFERTRRRDRLSQWETYFCHDAHTTKRPSRNGPSFAVARNCGIGSSSFNADVNAFERLHIVRGENS